VSESKSNKVSSSSGSIAFSSAAPEIRRPVESVKVPLSPISSMRARKTATNVAISKESQFNQTIVITPAIEALFGLPPEERFEEVKRACERNEAEALSNYVAPLTNWINDLDYVLDNYAEVVEALEDHFNRPGRPEAGRATWGDLGFDAEMLKYVDQKFQDESDTPISWAGICHVFFNRSIRTMQRRKAFQLMLSSGETVIPDRKKRTKSSASNNKPIDQAELEDIASRAVEWASENPDNVTEP
jgi:hypothetical protein